MRIVKSILAVALLVLSINTYAQETKSETFKKTLKVNGRIMFDIAALSAGDDYELLGSEFRRLRLSAKGKVAKNLSYALDFDFTGGKTRYRNVYLKYQMPKNYGSITAGSFNEVTGLDMLTSSKYITFIERAMMVATQYGKYNTGFMYQNHKLLDDKLTLQLQYTFNGKDAVAYKDFNLGGGANFIGRVAGRVYDNKEKNHLIHLGVNYEFRKDVTDEFGYKFRTENHVGKKTSIGTLGALKNTSDIGFEVAAVFGPLSIQGEYELASIVTDVDTYTTSGYYAYVSYFITGEHRGYKKGVFKRAKTKSTVGVDGIGAIELIARYSVMDLNGNIDLDGTDDKNYTVSNFTVGFNWHLNNNTRIMYNYVIGDHNDFAIPEYGDSNLTGHLARFQVDF